MLIAGSGLLISLPAEELRGMTPPASLFQPGALDGQPLSDELRWALKAASRACAAQKARMLIVARPEIFTHGASLAWLESQLMGIRDHLCLSDGTAVRPIRHMRNHLFLYRRGSHRHLVAFERLLGWVPELLDSVQSQVNTCISVRRRGRTLAPPTLLLQADAPAIGEGRLFLLRHHPELSVSVRRTGTARPRQLSSGINHVTYVPLTDSSCHSAAFMRWVAATIRTFQRIKGGCVVLRLPHSRESLEARLQGAMAALRSAGITKEVKTGSVLFAAGDLVPNALAAPGRVVDLLADTSYEFWRYPQDYFVGFSGLEIWSGGTARQQQAWQGVLNQSAGRLR